MCNFFLRFESKDISKTNKKSKIFLFWQKLGNILIFYLSRKFLAKIRKKSNISTLDVLNLNKNN